MASRFVPVTEAAARAAGTDNSEPARNLSGSDTVGFAERSSRQRLPRPRFALAIFQSESPGATRTVRAGETDEGATGEITGALSAKVAEGETGAETRGAGTGRIVLPGADGLAAENSNGAAG